MKRINKLIELLDKKNIEAFLVTDEANITYLTGFSGDSSRLIISKHGSYFLTDGRYTEQASIECFSEIKIIKWIEDKRYGIETYSYVLNKIQSTNLAFESEVISFSTYNFLQQGLKNINLIPVQGLVEQLRIVKDEEEIGFLRKACEISDNALEKTVSSIKVGMTEMEVLAQLEYNLKTNGADDISFDTMVLSGVKTSLLHGKADKKKIESGDFVLFDFGALHKGYHADISRTFVVGKASDKQKELYDIIRTAQNNACMSIKEGIHGTVPDSEVRKVIPEKYINYYYPGLGHGVGLVIHEEPFIKNTSDFIYKKGMTLTIEPGIYIPGWGGLRIEDTLAVTKNGVDILNSFPKDLIII